MQDTSHCFLRSRFFGELGSRDTFFHASPPFFISLSFKKVLSYLFETVFIFIKELFPFRALAVTRSYQQTEGQSMVLRRAKMLENILNEVPVSIQDGELIVGMKAMKPRGSPVFPEINCSWLEQDLDILPSRNNTPFYVSEETKKVLRKEVFPYWRGRQIYDRLVESVPKEIWKADSHGVIYNYFTSRTIGHITAGYAKVLNKGMNGIKKDIQNVLSITDVAILPTFYDPSSRFILETLAADKPVITTKFNGATDLFVNNRHGKVIDKPENITALAQAISYFTDKNNIQKASQAIIEDNLKEKISINRAARQLINVYESILHKKGQK